ncbi:armadillo-type protein [Mycena galopus ATCC 62051]|nr:armadillo-type protein [Mycena galopus ATCC 62051]
MKRRLGTGSESWGHSGSTAARSESAETVYPLTPSKLQKFGVHSPKELTAGTIATYILLLKSNLGLENVLVALGMLIRDPITANKVHRMGASAALIEIFDTTPSEDNAALAVWCLTRVCRSDDIANGLLKLNLAKLLVTKGFKSGSRIACVAGWCLGALIRSDTLADTLTDMGFVPALCENVRRCADSSSPEEQSAAIYTVARIARSIKAAEALARSGCAAVLAQYLLTTESPMVLLWSARAVGCLLGPDSTDMATVLLEAGVGRGLGRLPSTLSAGEVDALEGFAFAIQRFCSAEWGGEARKALVDAGIVKSLLDAQRSAANEPRPEIHIEIAHALARVADVGGASIRKQIVNGGAIEILKRVGNPAARPDVAKACNLAAKSITGNLWSRNQASSKVALSHDWSVGCPEHLPDCLSPVIDVSRDR